MQQQRKLTERERDKFSFEYFFCLFHPKKNNNKLLFTTNKKKMFMRWRMFVIWYVVCGLWFDVSFSYDLAVNLISAVDDLSMETGVPISVVFNGTNVSIWFDQRVLSFDNITVSLLLLVFDVACVLIIHAVFKGISGMGVLWRFLDIILFNL